MIRLEFSWAVALYLSICLGVLILYWAFFEKVKSLPNRSVSDRNVWHCAICTYFYIDSRHSDISVCPRCGSYNKKQIADPEKEVTG
ncbi:MAG: hypothetical protein A3F87_04910 [Omnitrophica WOR_2 bacterium RIFCSPLOWO2_12_FULL_51_24]|nr:MAG: hypothetical protein A3I43_06605 [Omnitrophica WOR_2 bacterium RIFCSPLOWO2_02_FULL_50_19]OGX42821.1 MAG: hypothetical protein A3F87_04910 [Omnitrophica WOR_2 bacterium RIFCSPLOWO2_12_FULL_51_24]